MKTGKKIPKLKTKPIAAIQDIVAAKQTSQDQWPSWEWATFDTQSFDMFLCWAFRTSTFQSAVYYGTVDGKWRKVYPDAKMLEAYIN